MITLEVQGCTVPHLKGLRYGKDESRGLSCGCTSSICQDVMKSDNLLHKWGFVDSLLQTIVKSLFDIQMTQMQVHCCWSRKNVKKTVVLTWIFLPFVLLQNAYFAGDFLTSWHYRI